MAYEVDEMADLDYLMRELPYEIIPGEEHSLRSSIFLERAIISERIRLAMGSPCAPLTRASPPARSAGKRHCGQVLRAAA